MALDVKYVKFRRGTPAEFEALLTKDPDSLYFISELNAQTGKLYLGSILISGDSNIGLSDLPDVLIGAGITNNSLLVYDGTQQKWVNKPLSEVLASIDEFSTMVGATASTDGAGGLVPQPLAGDQNKFLKGDGTWASPSLDLDDLRQDVADLQEVTTTIIGNDSDKSMREIAAEEVATIVGNAPAAYDTLQEIAAWIQDHPDSASDLNNRLTVVEGDVADLQSALDALENQQIDTVGDVADLQAAIEALQVKDVDLQTQIDVIDNRLKWQNVTDEEESEEPDPDDNSGN